MEYTYQTYEEGNGYYATMIRKAMGREELLWDAEEGAHFIIVLSPYGVSCGPNMERICIELQRLRIPPIEPYEVIPGYFIYFPLEGQCSCQLLERGCRYTVFACHKQGESYTVYEPYRLKDSCYDAPLELCIEVREEEKEYGILYFKKKKSLGYYGCYVKQYDGKGYHDGDISYEVEGYQIPITQYMLQQPVFYIKSEKKPTLIVHKKGIRLNEEKIG